MQVESTAPAPGNNPNPPSRGRVIGHDGSFRDRDNFDWIFGATGSAHYELAGVAGARYLPHD